jgi:hypothetical protein
MIIVYTHPYLRVTGTRVTFLRRERDDERTHNSFPAADYQYRFYQLISKLAGMCFTYYVLMKATYTPEEVSTGFRSFHWFDDVSLVSILIF